MKNSIRLKFGTFEDRLVPSTSAPALSIPPTYWQTAQFNPVAITPTDNGGTWVAGTTQQAGAWSWVGPWSNDWGLARLNANGAIDPAFNNGEVKEITAEVLDWFRIVQAKAGSDGKLYVLARNMVNDVYPMATGGTPAATLTSHDPATGQTTFTPYVQSMIWPYPLPNPVGAPSEGYAVVRFNADGTLDRTFNNDGIALFDIITRDATGVNIPGYDAKFSVDSKGNLVVATTVSNYGPDFNSARIAIAKLNANGAYETSFDTDGKAEYPVANLGQQNYVNLLGVAFGADGSVSVGSNMNSYTYSTAGDGTFATTPASAFFVAKLTAAGALDTTFDGDGFAFVTDSQFSTRVNSMVPLDISASDFGVTATGEYLFVGTSFRKYTDGPQLAVDVPNRGFVVNMTAAGQLDPTFDGDGILRPSYDSDRYVNAVMQLVTLPDGDFVVACGEELFNPNPAIIAMPGVTYARHNADGSVDSSMAVVRDANGGPYVTDVALLSNGNFMALTGFPQTLVLIDSDGVPTTKVTIPYDKSASWSPPEGWVPFPGFNDRYRDLLADVTGDGIEDRIFVSGEGSRSSIRVVNGADGTDLVRDFQPYEDRFTGGMFVDAGDFNGDGIAEIVVSPDDGGSARIQVFTCESGSLIQRANFFAIEDPNFRGGGSIGVIDINEDLVPDLVVGAARGGAQRLANFDGKELLGRTRSMPVKLFGDYFAPIEGLDPADYRGGVQITRGDFDGNGIEELRIVATGANVPTTLAHADGHSIRFEFETSSTPIPSMTLDTLTGIFVGG